jgi:hypothetical protein
MNNVFFITLRLLKRIKKAALLSAAFFDGYMKFAL